MGVAFAPLPPFKNWRVSEYLIWPFALSMGFMATYPDAPKLAFEIAINIQTVTSVAFLFQGWAVIYWWLEKTASFMAGSSKRSAGIVGAVGFYIYCTSGCV